MVVLSVLYVVPPHDFDFSKVAILFPLEVVRGRYGKKSKDSRLKSRLSSTAFSREISVPSSWAGASVAIKLDKAEDKAPTLGPFFDVGLVPAGPYLSLLSLSSSSSRYLAVVLVFFCVEA